MKEKRVIPEVPAVLSEDKIHLIVEVCPYCRGKHLHGSGGKEAVNANDIAYGHRVSHCLDNDNPGYYLVKPGTEKEVPGFVRTIMTDSTFSKINRSMNKKQRREWDEFKTELYLSLDFIRGRVRGVYLHDEKYKDLNDKVNYLMQLICTIPTFSR